MSFSEIIGHNHGDEIFENAWFHLIFAHDFTVIHRKTFARSKANLPGVFVFNDKVGLVRTCCHNTHFCGFLLQISTGQPHESCLNILSFDVGQGCLYHPKRVGKSHCFSRYPAHAWLSCGVGSHFHVNVFTVFLHGYPTFGSSVVDGYVGRSCQRLLESLVASIDLFANGQPERYAFLMNVERDGVALLIFDD